MSRLQHSLRWALPLAAALAAGCSKNEPVPGANAAQANTSAVASAANPAAPASPRGPVRTAAAPAPSVAIPEGDVNATLQRMTLALRDYVVRTRSVPKSFEEFAAKSQVRFPQPPAGQKYAIQGQEVVLVKR